MSEIWYRLENKSAVYTDEYGDISGRTEYILIKKFFLVKRTPKGVWISAGDIFGKRFVLLSATRRYAAPSIAEAVKDFIARKQKQISIHQRIVTIAERSIKAANRLAESGKVPDGGNVWL